MWRGRFGAAIAPGSGPSFGEPDASAQTVTAAESLVNDTTVARQSALAGVFVANDGRSSRDVGANLFKPQKGATRSSLLDWTELLNDLAEQTMCSGIVGDGEFAGESMGVENIDADEPSTQNGCSLLAPRTTIGTGFDRPALANWDTR